MLKTTHRPAFVLFGTRFGLCKSTIGSWANSSPEFRCFLLGGLRWDRRKLGGKRLSLRACRRKRFFGLAATISCGAQSFEPQHIDIKCFTQIGRASWRER